MTAPSSTPQAGHEPSRVPLKPILWCVAGFIATAVLIHLALIGYGLFLGAWNRDFGRVHELRRDEVPRYPAPALQEKPQVDLQQYRARAERELNGYGWVDQGRGVAKIPIERAMELLAGRGLPVRPVVQDGPTELDMQKQKAAADAAKATERPAAPAERRSP